MKAAVVLLSGALFVAGGLPAQTPVTLTVSTPVHGCLIPDDFAGLSFETGSEPPDRHRVSGYLFSATNKELVTLFRNIGLHNLRLGGGSVDGIRAVRPREADIDNLFEFARAVGDLHVIYSLQLLNGNAEADAETARYIWRKYRPWVAAFSVGNEPDWDSYHYPPHGTGTDPAIISYTSYLAAWRRCAAAVAGAVPGARFAGPDTGSYTTLTYERGKSWTQHFAEDEKNSGIVSVITQHYYVGGQPGKTTGPAAIGNLLSPGWVATNYAWLYNNNIAPLMADGLAYRSTEANDYITGVGGASDVFASALWALDFLHWWAAHGCSGVDFHNKTWLLTDTIRLDKSGHYQINPKTYGIKAFDLGGHGRTELVSIAGANQLNLTAYAVASASNLFVTIINKENGAGARDAAVTVLPNGVAAGSVMAMFLAALQGNVAATNGITVGGATLRNDIPWLGQWTSLGALTNGRCLVTVPAASAAVLKIVPVTFTLRQQIAMPGTIRSHP